MKETLMVLRLLLAERCLGMAMRLAPLDTDDGMDLVSTIRDYVRRSILRGKINERIRARPH